MMAKQKTEAYKRFFRKVEDTRGTFKKTWRLLGLYFTISNCQVKKRHCCGYTRGYYEKDAMYKAKRRLFDAEQGLCPHCGRPMEFGKAQTHHVLPYARFEELVLNERNTIVLCHDCHKEIHCNPWLNIRLMEQKAAELGIDLKERYDYGNETDPQESAG